MLLIYACMMNHFCVTIPRHAGHANGHIEQLYMCVVFTILGQLQVLLSLKVNYWALHMHYNVHTKPECCSASNLYINFSSSVTLALMGWEICFACGIWPVFSK